MVDIVKEIVEYAPFALILYGLFYVALPHTIHQVYSPDWILGINFPHEVHVILGIIMLLAGGFILFQRRK